MNDIKLSADFWFFELTDSGRHPELVAENRNQAVQFLKSGTYLAVSILQPVRDHFGRIDVDSGFRYSVLNAVNHGQPDSQHLLFEAADIVPKYAKLVEAFIWIARSAIPFGQLILEPTWLHISSGYPYRPQWKSKQLFVNRNGKYVPLQSATLEQELGA